jgi:hypothetical protein
MTVPVKVPQQGEIMESVLLKGDIAKLTPDERVRYYNEVCRSLGLNPLTKPFEFIVLNGKMQLYALRTCADQLRKINSVSLQIVSREVADGILTIHVRATLPDGRSDEDLGAVAFPDTLKGEARANAELKAITKAKRRATMSICGLGWLDETEVADIPASAKRPAPPAANVMLPLHNAETGEVIEDQGSPRSQNAAEQAASPQPLPPPGEAADELTSDDIAALDAGLAAAAEQGSAALQVAWRKLPFEAQSGLKAALDRRHKPAAKEADKALA